MLSQVGSRQSNQPTQQQKVQALNNFLSNNQSPLLATSGASLVDRLYNTVSGQPATTLGDTLSNKVSTPILQTLQPIVNILTIIQSGYFWINVFGLVIGFLIVLLAIQSLMKQELLSEIKKNI